MALGKGETLNQDGTYEKIMKAMKKTPTKLFTIQDVMKLTKKDHKSATSALAYLWRHERIYRHIDKNDDNQFQYAITINEDKRVIYQPGQRYSKGDSSADAIKKSFSTIMGELLKLEETVLSAFEEMKDAQAKLDQLQKVAKVLKNLED